MAGSSTSTNYRLNPFYIEAHDEIVQDDSGEDHFYLDKYNSEDYSDGYDSCDEDEFFLREGHGGAARRADHDTLHSRGISVSLFHALLHFRLWNCLSQTPSLPRRLQVIFSMSAVLLILLLASSHTGQEESQLVTAHLPRNFTEHANHTRNQSNITHHFTANASWSSERTDLDGGGEPVQRLNVTNGTSAENSGS